MAFEDREIGDVIDLVAAKLDAVVTTETTPSSTQVVAWLNEGLNFVMKSLPDDRLAWAMRILSGSNVTSHYSTVDANILRMVSVSKFGHHCTRMSLAEFNFATRNMPHIFSEHGPRYAITGGMAEAAGEVVLRFAPTNAGDVEIEAIVRPNFYTLDYWNANTDRTPPREIEDIVVDYAVIQGKVQDEELEQANMLWNQWKEKYQIETQSVAIGTTEHS